MDRPLLSVRVSRPWALGASSTDGLCPQDVLGEQEGPVHRNDSMLRSGREVPPAEMCTVT